MQKESQNKLAKFIFIIHLFWVLWAIISLPLVILFHWYLIINIIFLVTTITNWLFFKECSLNRWEYKFKGLDYDRYKSQGTFIGRLLKIFSIDISRRTAVRINQIFISILLFITLLKLLKFI